MSARRMAVMAMVLLTAVPVFADDDSAPPQPPVLVVPDVTPPPQHESLKLFPERVWRDFGALVRTPLEMDGRDWAKLGIAVAAVGAVATLDTPIERNLQAHSTPRLRSFATAIRPIGTWGGIAAMGVTWIAGRAAGRPGLESTAADGLEATLIAAGVITPLLKAITGRVRPADGHDMDSFHLFNTGDNSFPSGEATEAFALAAVVAGHSDKTWEKGVAWGLAGLVGWERMELDRHWASDIAAGALIGAAVGHWVVHRHEEERAGHLRTAIAPMIGKGGMGVQVALSW